jgi:hypothetical protein
MITIRQLIIITIIFAFSSCTLDNNEIRQHEWKYGEGSRPGHDFFAFGGGVFKLYNDTVFFLDTAIATVIDTRKNYYLYDNEITLKNLKTGKAAIYNDLGKVKAEDTVVTIELKQIDLEAPPIPEEK